MRKTVSPLKKSLNEIKRGVSRIAYPLWNSFKKEEERYGDIVLIPSNGSIGYKTSRREAIKIIKDVALRLILKADDYHVINLGEHSELGELIYRVAKEWRSISYNLENSDEEIKTLFRAAALRVNNILYYSDVDFGIKGLTLDKVLRPSLTSIAISFSYSLCKKKREGISNSWIRAAKMIYHLLSELNLRKSAEILSRQMVDLYPGGDKINEYYKRYRAEMGKIAKEVKTYLKELNPNPRYGINKRIKSPYSAYLKLIKRIGEEKVVSSNFNEDVIRKEITDFIGLQFIANKNEDLDNIAYLIIEKLESKGLKLDKVKYYNVEGGKIDKVKKKVMQSYSKYAPSKITVEAKKSGYKAIHLIFTKNLKEKSYPVEVEIMYEDTYEEFKLGQYRHSKYKSEITDKILSILGEYSYSSIGNKYMAIPVFVEERVDHIFLPPNAFNNLDYLLAYFRGRLRNPNLVLGNTFNRGITSIPLARIGGFDPVLEVKDNSLELKLNGSKVR